METAPANSYISTGMAAFAQHGPDRADCVDKGLAGDCHELQPAALRVRSVAYSDAGTEAETRPLRT